MRLRPAITTFLLMTALSACAGSNEGSTRPSNAGGATPVSSNPATGVRTSSSATTTAATSNPTTVGSTTASDSTTRPQPTGEDTTATSTTPTPPKELIGDKPWTLTVLSDSTGTKEAGLWVDDLGQLLAERYQRPVTVHQWDPVTLAYGATDSYGSGTGPAITIWNGSASGTTAIYGIQWRSKLMPEPSDAVIINHGHNNPSAQDAVAEINSLTAILLRDNPELPVFVTLQNPRFDAWQAKGEETVETIREKFTGTDVRLIDVNRAFLAADDPRALLTPDTLHIAEPGGKLWATTAAQALGVPGA